MRDLLDFEDNFTCSDVDIFICGILEVFLVTIRSTLLDEEVNLVKSCLCLGRSAHMADGSLNLACSRTFLAFYLELLNESWS
jgi:hypothetical protein|tara:strand:+ start:402 stop:647 length:246 start_codon:yes stop_codon:yes gene_type:complete